ncbi:MRN complex-interacting protein isoform X3 [Rhinolophus ferrumequinum]|uniref:MRN complex-interacting protein isoform X3 n=1 Tax=Rhinolophus ferrumequinum TaxID=59479 RepID=UPI00140F73C5|nr:MRN complex-interacting protein isoform X3 [Rhinolophus ferrumequinum]
MRGRLERSRRMQGAEPGPAGAQGARAHGAGRRAPGPERLQGAEPERTGSRSPRTCARAGEAVKKSLKWTCKACGEKQSFLRAYGEGSGADCRRHVQKLNLLQGQVSEMSLRSLEEPGNADEEKDAGLGHTDHMILQEKPKPSENRWLKYIARGSRELGPEAGACFNSWPSSTTEKPDPPFHTSLPRKRRWSQSTTQPLCSPDGQDLGDSEVTLETQKDPTGLTGKVREGNSHEDWNTRALTGPWGEPPRPVQKSSKWERFLFPPGNSSHVHTESPTPLHRHPRPAAQAEEGTPRAQTPREGSLSRMPGVLQLPLATHTPTSGPKRPFKETPEHLWGTGSRAEAGPSVRGAQEPPLVRLCDLFNTGEDFDDNL